MYFTVFRSPAGEGYIDCFFQQDVRFSLGIKMLNRPVDSFRYGFLNIIGELAQERLLLGGNIF
jgi:hypothetical protein